MQVVLAIASSLYLPSSSISAVAPEAWFLDIGVSSRLPRWPSMIVDTQNVQHFLVYSIWKLLLAKQNYRGIFETKGQDAWKVVSAREHLRP